MPRTMKSRAKEVGKVDEDVLNLEIRKFLKRVGITSQREIEKAVQHGLSSGALQGAERVQATVLLRLPALGIEFPIDGEIALQ